MSSSFGLLTTAYSGLAAARAALEVTGQNVANVNTAGYTRQRVQQVSVPGVDYSRLSTTGLNVGQGTQITGIARLADSVVDARVRDGASTSGYWSAASAALSGVEDTLGEPGDTGLSKALSNFWDGWQTMAANPGTGDTAQSSAAALLGSARTLTARLAAGATSAQRAWSGGLTDAQGDVAAVNQAGAQIAALNEQILRITGIGGNANELVDQRSTAVNALAGLTGAATRQNANGTVDVLIGGSTFVSGGTSATLRLAGSATLDGVTTSPVHVEFADRPGATVQLEGGSLAARVASLGPASGGTGGVYAETAKAYDDVAASLASTVNALHRAGATPDGTTGHDFFGPGTGAVRASTLTVLPTSAAGIASGAPAAGANDGSVADAIAQIGLRLDGPDAVWSGAVTRLGAQTKNADTQATISGAAATAATKAQTSQSGVDLDEETANLVVYQHAYQGAARVLSAIDEMLDTLINHTGLVGR